MRSRLSRVALVALCAVAAVAAFAVPGAVGAGAADDSAPSVYPGWDVPAPLGTASGTLNVVATLTDPSLARATKELGLTPAQQRQYVQELQAKQAAVVQQAESLGATKLAGLTKSLNAVVLRTDSFRLSALQSLAGISMLRPISDYRLDLGETVPYIGAAQVQSSGFDGTGVRVAVLDSGIDYTHRSFGGPGTAAAYTAAYGTSVTDARTTTRDGLFPTTKVIGGWDFVGEGWPTLALAPDEDPIDCGPATIPAPCAGGHGSHVSDITAGIGPNKGVAPGAKLYMFKVCSARSTSCSGVALLRGVDAALDPNGDDSIADRADVINLSLGSSYGQKEDDLSAALQNAVAAGSVVVTSAGNAADRPYIVGSPSSAPEVISVAQTQVPSALLFRVVAGSVTVGAVHQPWSAAPSLVSGSLAYDTTSGAHRIGCTNAAGGNPYAPGSHTGQVLIIDRGTCAVSLKVANAASAGAIVAIVANNVSQAPGDLPPSFSFGGPGFPPTAIAGYTVTLVDGNLLKGVLGTTATINPASAAALVGNMAPSSSRGPSFSYNAIKPDIGAPGASVSAEAGTGTLGTAFSGTSGAAPMVAGSAALLLDKNPSLSVAEVKSLLMSTAETNIGLNPIGLPGVLAPITRIGGGEVRVNRAAASGTAAWEVDGNGASLSFGYWPIADSVVVNKKVAVRNYGSSSKTYAVSPSFRFAADQSNGAVTIETPSSITVPAGQTGQFNVKLTIDASKLPTWDLNGGSRGGDGFRLQGVEYDGYISINGGTNDNVHVAWHVLPHKSAEVRTDRNTVPVNLLGTGSFNLRNQSRVLDGRADVFSLTGTSDRIQKRFLPSIGENFAVVDLKSVGVRQSGANIQFAIDTFGARAHPNYPAEFDIYIDSNRDGTDDFVVFNLENGGFGATGQNVVAVANLATNASSVLAFADADLNSGNSIMGVPMSAVGLTPTTKFDFSVYAFDNYFTGFLTDAVEGMTYTLGTPRFAPSATSPVVPAGDSLRLAITSPSGGGAASPSQLGLLLMYRDAGFRGGNDASRTEAEAVMVGWAAAEPEMRRGPPRAALVVPSAGGRAVEPAAVENARPAPAGAERVHRVATAARERYAEAHLDRSRGRRGRRLRPGAAGDQEQGDALARHEPCSLYDHGPEVDDGEDRPPRVARGARRAGERRRRRESRGKDEQLHENEYAPDRRHGDDSEQTPDRVASRRVPDRA